MSFYEPINCLTYSMIYDTLPHVYNVSPIYFQTLPCSYEALTMINDIDLHSYV